MYHNPFLLVIKLRSIVSKSSIYWSQNENWLKMIQCSQPHSSASSQGTPPWPWNGLTSRYKQCSKKRRGKQSINKRRMFVIPFILPWKSPVTSSGGKGKEERIHRVFLPRGGGTRFPPEPCQRRPPPPNPVLPCLALFSHLFLSLSSKFSLCA